MVKFIVFIPAGSPAGDISLEIIDEVTGLAFNPTRYKLQDLGSNAYSIEVPIPLGSDVKYRYIRISSPIAVEYTGDGNQVRYRLIKIFGPETITDFVTAWSDYRYTGPTGRIKGMVLNKATNAPIPNAMILVGGTQSLSSADGSFSVEGLAPGLHTLAVYAMDGSFYTYFQGAVIAENMTTPVTIHVESAPLVRITFIVQTPEDSIQGLPLRLVGNLYKLGNTFADLEGGMSVVAARSPLMTAVTDGIFSITLELPVGYDLRYKYTLGDGFWNAEHDLDGNFVIRQLIVPDHDETITDLIETWRSGDSAPIVFSVTVPDSTPSNDIVSIQFNPFGWTPAIPMWPLGNYRWLYVLYSPFNLIEKANYRYCRNDQCGWADDIKTQGPGSMGFPFSSSGSMQTFEDVVEQWHWPPNTDDPGQVVALPVTPREPNFIAGVEIAPDYSPSRQPYIYWGFNYLQELGTNLTIISPSWQVSRLNPLSIKPLPGVDMLWFDILQTIQTSRQNNINVALFPHIRGAKEFLSQINGDISMVTSWLNQYQNFTLHFADLCEQQNIPVLILDADEISPTFVGEEDNLGRSSIDQNIIETELSNLISEIRKRYTGAIALYFDTLDNDHHNDEWISQFDLIYVSVSDSLTNINNPDTSNLTLAVNNILDSKILPLVVNTDLPVWIGIYYPSFDGVARGCIDDGEKCQSFEAYSDYTSVSTTANVDVQEQAMIYQAFLESINNRQWISGVIARGFNPTVAQVDPSASIYGKPAADILWYWFPQMSGD